MKSLSDAVSLINADLMKIKGLLHQNNLTWTVRLIPTSSGLFSPRYTATRGNSNQIDFANLGCAVGTTPEELIKNIFLLEEGRKAGKIRPTKSDCCILATEVACVCRRATTCPIHGDSHFGSHD